jgi:hypothetical protein
MDVEIVPLNEFLVPKVRDLVSGYLNSEYFGATEPSS